MVKRPVPHDADAPPTKRQRTTRSEVIDLTMSSSDESVAGPSRPRAASHAPANGSAQAAPSASTPEGYFASFYKTVTTVAKNLTEGFYGAVTKPNDQFDYSASPLNFADCDSESTLPRYSTTKHTRNGTNGANRTNRLRSTTSIETATSTASSVPSTVVSRSKKELEDERERLERNLRFTRGISPKSGGAVQKPKRHIHILADTHRKTVKENQMKDLIQLYELKKKQGYTSSYEDFIGLQQYRILVDDAQNNKLDTTVAAVTRDEKLEDKYMKRALDKARVTLSSPLPPRPVTLQFEQLEERQRRRDAEIEARLRPPRKPLPAKLPPAIDSEVTALFSKQGPISKVAREAVSSSDIARLRPQTWLNDEVINFFGAMILERSDAAEREKAQAKGKSKSKVLKVHYFNTFFWPKLCAGYEASKLSKWTKKIDIFSKDVILIPINHRNAHWTAATINFKKKRIESYDSMHMSRPEVLKGLRNYVELEHKDKRKKPFDWTGWEDYEPSDCPEQENGFDCGVFTCQFLESASRGVDFNFSQKDMPYLRRRMVYEIGKSALLESDE